ncbi:MAG: sigma-70 family RNA polymerase sigma factor [Clostridiales Family XIII bacterium]|jgi:RNA polymerase sigma-70 factor (ECF subfamily)|nr:sigma-70 family RNA polymerase sigma factor [Clostridiales Family XIII bacterium]
MTVDAVKDKDISKLVIEAQRGDIASFEELYRIFAKSILYHVRGLLVNKQDTEDAAQEVVLEMYKSIRGLRSPYAFSSWMHRIIANVCYARNDKEKALDERARVDSYGGVLSDQDKDVCPEEVANEKDRAILLANIINGLSESRRRAVIMYYYDGMSYKEIAKALGVTISTVSTNILKAKKMIRKEIENRISEAKGVETYLGGIAIADAIAADVARRFPFESVERFSCATDGRLHLAAKELTSASKGEPRWNRSFALKIASFSAVAGVAALICAIIFNLSDTPSAPLIPEQKTTSVYRPVAEIILESEDCACGHVNPQQAQLLIDEKDVDIRSWSIAESGDAEKEISDNIVRDGEGDVISSDLRDLSPGTYQIRWIVSNAEGSSASVLRDILITDGPVEPGLYE